MLIAKFVVYPPKAEVIDKIAVQVHAIFRVSRIDKPLIRAGRGAVYFRVHRLSHGEGRSGGQRIAQKLLVESGFALRRPLPPFPLLNLLPPVFCDFPPKAQLNQ